MGRTLCAATGFMLTFGGESRAKKTLYYLHFLKGGGFGTSEIFSLKNEEMISCSHLHVLYFGWHAGH